MNMHVPEPESFGPTPVQPRRHWQETVPVALGVPAIAGLAVVAIFVCGFIAWSATAPLSGAVVASGVVQAQGQNQIVDHYEGGIVSAILVNEGDRVQKGDLLITLDEIRVRSERNRVMAALLATEAQLARANAERDGSTELSFASELEARAAMSGAGADLEQQRAEFTNRLQRHMAERGALELRKRSVDEEIEGLKIQIAAEERKLEVIRSELDDKEALLKKGLTQKSQVTGLQRAESDSLGRIGALRASAGQRLSSIAEIDEQLAGLEAARREAASQQSNEIRMRMADLSEQLEAREDVLDRSRILAPVSGVIVKLAKNTVGSAVRPGEPVAEILPTGDALQIDARVAPRDVDAVRRGQDAYLRFSALNVRTTPEVPARISYLSADRLVDPDTREPYYSARLEIVGELPAEIAVDQIHPGMPVDAFIKTGERTFLEYLVKPVQDSLSKAFREE